MPVVPLRKNQPKNSSYNFERIRTEFIAILESEEKSPHTVKNYLCDLDAFVRWWESQQNESLTVDAITSIDLREYKRHLIDLDYKPQSVNRKLATLRTFLTWCEERSFIPAVPKVPKPIREQQTKIRWLDRKEQNALLRRVEKLGSDRDQAIVKLLLNTGLRVSELCALVWSDVTLSPKKGKLVVRSGKGGKRREIPLNPDARAALVSLGYNTKPNPVAKIVTGQRGTMSPRGIETMLRKYRGDLEELSPHSLRHTFCKNLVDAGVGIERVAALAGHTSLDTTRRYCEPSYRDLEKAVELISEDD